MFATVYRSQVIRVWFNYVVQVGFVVRLQK